MPRNRLATPLALLVAAAPLALALAPAAAQENQGTLRQIGEINAAEYIRGVLANDQYDPRDRERARNYQPELEAGTHWRSSIHDGQRTRATRGTGIRLPDLNRGGD
jgi:hypothetical protein